MVNFQDGRLLHHPGLGQNPDNLKQRPCRGVSPFLTAAPPPLISQLLNCINLFQGLIRTCYIWDQSPILPLYTATNPKVLRDLNIPVLKKRLDFQVLKSIPVGFCLCVHCMCVFPFFQCRFCLLLSVVFKTSLLVQEMLHETFSGVA